jgi:hypothetical protein
MDYLNNHGYTNSYKPRREATSVYNGYTQKQTNLANSVYLDSLSDLHRWCSEAKKEINDYVITRGYYEEYLMNTDDPRESKYKEKLSDQRGFLVDMRKGIDWFKNTYTKRPKVLTDFYDYINDRQERLTRLKKYLSTRVRKYSALNYINDTDHSLEISKYIQRYVNYELKLLDIFTSKDRRYVERKTMEQIMGGTEE